MTRKAAVLVVAVALLGALALLSGSLRSSMTVGLIGATLRYATPLVLAGIGGLVAERSGVTNIGIEGMMLTGAFFGIWGADVTNSWVGGLLIAAVTGAALAALHGVFCIHLRANQGISGVALTVLATGITGLAFRAIYGSIGTPAVHRIPTIHLPLGWIPVAGDQIDRLNLMVWIAILAVPAAAIFLERTPWGTRLTAVGEHPRAAATVGISVYRYRYAAVVFSGVAAALAGAYLSFGLLSSFTEGMSAGRGFIALAVVIFGGWRAGGIMLAAGLFAFTSALGDSLQTNADVSANLVSLLPYAATLVVLVIAKRSSSAPAALGHPYAKQ